VVTITKYLVACLTLAMSGSPAIGQATNMAVVADVTDSLVIKLVAGNPDILKGAICIHNRGPGHEADWLFETRLIKYLKSVGVNDIFIPDNSQTCSSLDEGRGTLHEVDYQVHDIRIGYSREKASIAAELRHRRNVAMTVAFRVLAQPDGKVLWSDELKQQSVDLVSTQAIKALEEETVDFTHGHFVEQEESTGVLQPLLVTTVTGIVIYLFYAFRSR
jgi:hypothetical protein